MRLPTLTTFHSIVLFLFEMFDLICKINCLFRFSLSFRPLLLQTPEQHIDSVFPSQSDVPLRCIAWSLFSLKCFLTAGISYSIQFVTRNDAMSDRCNTIIGILIELVFACLVLTLYSRPFYDCVNITRQHRSTFSEENLFYVAQFTWKSIYTVNNKKVAHNNSINVNQCVAIRKARLTVVRDLGVWFDAEVSMRSHVSRVAQTCFFTICAEYVAFDDSLAATSQQD